MIKIKIITADKINWYKNQIGSILNVKIDKESNMYRPIGLIGYAIHFSHCKIIENYE